MPAPRSAERRRHPDPGCLGGRSRARSSTATTGSPGRRSPRCSGSRGSRPCPSGPRPGRRSSGPMGSTWSGPTVRGVVTDYTLFVIELASRRVRIVGSTPHPDGEFMQQIARELVAADEGVPAPGCLLICDRDATWSTAVRAVLASGGVRVVQTPVRAPNANAYAERFVRSIKEQCLDRVVPLGERYVRHLLREYVAHYHHERTHQGRGKRILQWRPPRPPGRQVRRRQRLGGLLNYCCRAGPRARASSSTPNTSPSAPTCPPRGRTSSTSPTTPAGARTRSSASPGRKSTRPAASSGSRPRARRPWWGGFSRSHNRLLASRRTLTGYPHQSFS